MVDVHDGAGGLSGELGVVNIVMPSLEVEEFKCVRTEGVVSEVVVD